MRLYPFFVTPSSPINALTSNLFRVRLGIKRIVTPHSIYLSHSLACPLCVPLRRFVYSHTCMSVDPVGKARSKSDYGLFFISFLSSLDWDNKEETRKRSVYRLRVFPQTTFDIVFRQVERIERGIRLLLFHYVCVYVRAFKAFHFLNLQWQIYALFLNFQNFLKKFYKFTSKLCPEVAFIIHRRS